MNIKNIYPAYGAVLLLLTSQFVLGASQRQAAQHFNRCVQVTQSQDRISDELHGNSWGYPLNRAVSYCNGSNY